MHRVPRFIPLFLLAGCAVSAPPSGIPPTPPPQWYAALPHNGTLTDLSQWWQQQGDPLLARLIVAAQDASPTIAAARSRIEQARATQVAAGAALLPTLDGTGSIQRASAQPPTPLGTTSQVALQTAWEIDLFGANRYTRDAAQARYQGAQASWHDARVSVAAEVANQYYGYRTCLKLMTITAADAASRAETNRLAELSANAGFTAPATAALARAAAAEGSNRATQQRAQCELDLKALVALTAMPEPALRQQLDQAAAGAAVPIVLDSLPARTLAQRPDIFNAEREIAAASAEAGSAQAQRYPRLALSGSIGVARFEGGGLRANLDTWSIGPLSLTVPLFDGGRRAANVDAANARYAEAVTNYRASVRQAVREVEQALVTLQSTDARTHDTMVAVEGYRASFAGTEALYRGGLASLVELEEVRRTRLAAEIAQATLEQERNAAWVALYRAAGGGWNADSVVHEIGKNTNEKQDGK